MGSSGGKLKLGGGGGGVIPVCPTSVCNPDTDS